MRPPFWDTGISSSSRLLGIGAIYLVLAAWIKYVVAPKSLGNRRFLASLPIFAANTVCPWIFDARQEVLQRTSTVFIFSWLCNFKVLAFCWGRAPLQDSMTVPQIAAITLLPIFPKPPDVHTGGGPQGRLQDSAGSSLSLAIRWLAKIVLLGAVTFVVVLYGDVMPRPVRHYIYAFGLYAFVGFLMDGPAALAVEALGLQLIPTFDQPWRSASLAEFWGRRWNIPTTSVLRTVVYDTVVDGCLIKPLATARLSLEGAPEPTGPETSQTPEPQSPEPTQIGQHIAAQSPSAPKQQRQKQQKELEPKQQKRQQAGSHPFQPQRTPMGRGEPRSSMLRRQLGLHATFLVSGLLHEYIAWLVCGTGEWGWKWTAFFYMQAPLLTAEALACRALRRVGVSPPRALTTLLTIALLEVLAYDLFFGFVERDTDLAARVITAVSGSYRGLLTPLQPALASLADWLQQHQQQYLQQWQQ